MVGMIDMDRLKDIALVVYYFSLSITGPVALWSYWRSKKKELEEREYRTYDELDNKYLEYQKLALEFDLDLIDLPDYSPELAGDRLRLKHQLVTASCGFSLFQRAFLMFHGQSDEFKTRQWQGWDRLLNAFLLRVPVRRAWEFCKLHFDTDFQALVDDRAATLLAQAEDESPVIFPMSDNRNVA
jgi:hypothetical protein